MLLAGKGFELLPLQRRKPQQYRLELERGLAYLTLTSAEVYASWLTSAGGGHSSGQFWVPSDS